MKKFTQNQLRDYASLFSRSQVFAWEKSDFGSLKQKIERYDIKWSKDNAKTYKDYLKYIYKVLEFNYASEYIIKNSFLNEWLIPELSQGNTTAFSEFRVGDSVADLATFNGVSKAFEIKTEFDSSCRLRQQLDSYKKIFNEVYLIIPESKFFHYEKIDRSVGIISYNMEKDKKFLIQRPSSIIREVDIPAQMNILHTQEYKSILIEYFGDLPNMTSFTQFEKSKKMISNIPFEHFDMLFIRMIKRRVMSTALSIRNFKEINQLSLALKLEKNQRSKILENLSFQITD